MVFLQGRIIYDDGDNVKKIVVNVEQEKKGCCYIAWKNSYIVTLVGT